ncbi:type 4 prepilin peptidase 1 Aspartic peptidase. MEROPS family A24A [Oceanobacillus limi]|uniref:Type 4 prepilin peptidase 1 Aspartic peptidase. MEROPS family A24A n=1 Tax=Oceanobacillus limi TaxID=930131 RepID=A0A1I0EJ73_9BACI|nr:A24 family peptidase [Oceanobacillus limi]SET45005.1 type 4 prepilin peptidase 1 Aspartic peptidase. MEROPS family A24A [Oceanobacillus limi]
MYILISTLFFLFGLIFGSFYNVVGLRVPKNEPFTNDRSICPHCKQTLSWYELIPVLSYIFQGGKCRNCKTKISMMYPIIELSTGILFSLSYVKYGFTMELITSLLLVSMLMIIVVSDIKYMLIPNKVLLFFLPLFVILRIITPLDPWWSSLTGAISGLGIIAIIILISRGGMGAGDMKLFAVLGIVLGFKNVLLTFFLSCIIGSVFGVVLILIKFIKRNQPVPFGPYIVLATLLTYFYGEKLIDWYINFFQL